MTVINGIGFYKKKELSRAKIDYEVSHQSKKAEIERLQAKLDDIDRYGTLNEHDLREENERIQTIAKEFHESYERGIADGDNAVMVIQEIIGDDSE